MWLSHIQSLRRQKKLPGWLACMRSPIIVSRNCSGKSYAASKTAGAMKGARLVAGPMEITGVPGIRVTTTAHCCKHGGDKEGTGG